MRRSLHQILTRPLAALLIACFLPCLVVLGATTATAPEPGVFPSIHATSLDGKKVHLPQDFSGQLNLVLISFTREQQKEVDTWLPLARRIQSAHGNFSYYELPTTSRDDLLYRWWFDSSLRSNATDKDLRGRTLTAYVSKHSFHKKLHITDEKRMVAVLVDRSGKIYWRADGSLTGQAQLALQSALAANGV